jgi:PAS domain S-box-containing protein
MRIWDYAYTPYIWSPVCTVFILLILAVYGWRRRSVPGALAFAAGSLLAAIWVACSALEYSAVDMAAKIFWLKARCIWQLPATTAITCFLLEYVWPGRWLTRRNLALLSIVPLLNLGMILTNDLHHLEWRDFLFNGALVPVQGPLVPFLVAYGYGLGLVNLLTLIWMLARSQQNRWPAAIMMTGQIAARTAFLLESYDVFYTDIPIDALVIGCLFLIYAIVLFRFRILDPIPLAQQMAIEQMHTGMLVLDPRGKVISLNPAVEKIFRLPSNRIQGRLVYELIPAYLDGPVSDSGGTEIEFSLPYGGTKRKAGAEETRYYTLTISVLKDWRGLETGRLLLLRDITEQKLAHARVVEQQRALAILQERERLARELHDNLGQVFAFINVQGQVVRRLLSRGEVETADSYVDRLVEVAREADVDVRESILGLRATLSDQGLFSALERYLVRYEKNYGIQCQLERSAAFVDEMFEPTVEVQLLRILQEALTNVRKHSEAQCVSITFEKENGNARILVKDDGLGFDPMARDKVSSEHVGLRVMRERAEEVGGNLNLLSKPGQGTVVEIRMPVKK